MNIEYAVLCGGLERRRKDTDSTETGQCGGSPLRTDRGATTISSAVVSSIAGAVVREASGAEPEIAGRGTTLPGDNSPTVGEFLDRVTGSASGARGRSIPEISQEMRDAMIRRIESLTGLEVTEVDFTLRDVFVPQQ